MTIDDISSDELFEKLAKNGESLGLAKLSAIQIRTPNMNALLGQCRTYFNTGMNSGVKLTKFHSDTILYDAYMIEKAFIKYVYLTRELMQNKEFDNLLCAHWSPDFNKFCIHPGSGRYSIVYLFGDYINDYVVFNTGGNGDVEYIEKYNSYDDIFKKFPTETYRTFIELVELHGTIVPQLHFLTADVLSAMDKIHKQAKQFFKTTKIIANFDLDAFGYSDNIVRDHRETMNVTIDKLNDEHVLRAFFLMPSFKNFNGHGVKLETTSNR